MTRSDPGHSAQDRRAMLVTPYAVLGAAEAYVFTLSSGLVSRGWSVSLAHPSGLPTPEGLPPGIERLRLPDSILRQSRWLSRLEPTLMHVNHAALPVLAAARVQRTHPVVVTSHTPALSIDLSRRGRVLRSFAQPGIDRWIVLSDSNRDLLAKSTGVHPDAISVVHPGLPTLKFETLPSRSTALGLLGLPEGSVVVGTVGRLAEQKRHDILLKAFARASGSLPNMRLVIIGEGELGHQTRELAQKLSPDRVVFTGHRKDVVDLLPAFSVFAMSSDFEGLPFALLEAMATARPIVTSDVQGMGEAVRNDREGLLVPRRDPAALADGIVRLLKDPDLASRLGRAARERFLAEFTANLMVRRTEDVYLELLERSRSTD